MVNIAINGIGRIGKLALKILVSNNVNVKYINELNGNPSNLLHSLEFDSIHGKWIADFKANDNSININERAIRTTFYNNIEDMDLNDIDIVIDCTGVNNNKAALKKYF